MKYLLLITFLFACKSKPRVDFKKDSDLRITILKHYTDSLNNESQRLFDSTIRLFDTLMIYRSKYQEYQLAAQKAQIDYLQSGGDKKHERLFYKYDKLRVEYAKKAIALQNKMSKHGDTK